MEAARTRILEHYVAWLQSTPPPEELADEHEALERTMRHALEHGRWREAVILGRALSNALLWSRRLGAWGAAISAVHRAAEALGDTSATAWALHEEGVRGWWLRGGEAGIAQLEEALRLRRDVLRDRAAAERTQRTLDAIRPPSPPSWWQRWHVLPLLVALLVLGLGTAGAVQLLGGGEATNRELTVTVLGDGVVIARYDDGQRRCRTECHVTVADGIAVDLSPEGEGFEAWSGDCGGSGECSLMMDGDRAVTAQFAGAGTPTPTPTESPSPTPARTHVLTVEPSGDGTGTVVSDPDGIDCGQTCEHAFDDRSTVTVEAIAEEGSRFAGWGNRACADDETTCRLQADGRRAAGPQLRPRAGS